MRVALAALWVAAAERDGRARLEIPARETCTIDALPLR
jgi:hypothetical protein